LLEACEVSVAAKIKPNMTDKLKALLKAEGIEHLIPTLVDQGIVDSMLTDLTESDLKSLGIDKLGERKRLLAVLSSNKITKSSAAQNHTTPPKKTGAPRQRSRANLAATEEQAMQPTHHAGGQSHILTYFGPSQYPVPQLPTRASRKPPSNRTFHSFATHPTGSVECRGARSQTIRFQAGRLTSFTNSTTRVLWE